MKLNNCDYIYLGLHNVSSNPLIKNSTNPKVLENILLNAKNQGRSFNLFDLNPKKLILTFDDGRKFDDELTGILNKFNATGIFFICFNKYIESYSNNELNEVLDNENINYIKSRHLAGLHTNNHTMLKGKSFKEQYSLIKNNYSQFIEIFGYKPRYFSYPWGKYDLNTIKILKKMGIDKGFTASPGSIVINQYITPRIFIDYLKINSFSEILSAYNNLLNNIKLVTKSLLYI